VKPSVLEVNRSISTPTCTLMERLEKDLDKVRDLEFNFNEADKLNRELKNTTIPTGNTLKTNLDNSISTGTTLKNDIDNRIVTGNKLKTDIDNSSTVATTKKEQLDGANVQAKKNIETLNSFGDASQLTKDVTTLKTKVLENTLTSIETDSTLTKLDNCENGFVRNMQIKGRTLQNLWNNENVVNLKNDTMLIQTISTDDFRINMLKDNIEYSIVNLSNKKTRADITTKNSNTYVKTLYIEPHSIQKFTISSQYISSFYGLISEGWTNTDSDKDIFKKACMILEGELKEVPSYFEGIKSVGEAEGNKISILTTGKNLWDGTYQKAYVGAENGRTYRNDDACRATIVKCKPNTNYIFSKQSESDRKTMACFDNFPVNNSVATKSVLSDKITTDANSKYLVVYVSTNREEPLIQIEEGTESTAYEEYKEDKTEILLPSPHMGLPDGVSDIVDFDKNERIKNVDKMILDGTRGWTVTGVEKPNTIEFQYNFPIIARSSYLLSDKFIFRDADFLWNSDVEGITCNPTRNIQIKILKSKLSTPDVAGFKKWLQANPTTVYYQLAEPKTEKLNIKDTLQSFENGYIQLDNAITPTTQLEYSTNIPSAIGGLTKVVDHNVDEITNIESTISDMDAEIGEARKGKTTLEERLEEDRINILNEVEKNTNNIAKIDNFLKRPIIFHPDGTDLNTVTQTGLHRIMTAVNSPLGSAMDFMVDVFNPFEGNNSVIQMCYCLWEGADIIYERKFVNNKWYIRKIIPTDDTGWIDLPLTNGITVDGNIIPQYRRVNNQVFICGSILGVDSSAKTVATLPVGFRPSRANYYVGFTTGTYTNAIRIDSNGNIIVQSNSSGTYDPTRFATLGTNFII
ncbi:pyocin knob domain-containing protein, partial [Clostridium botulinum]